MNKAVLFMRFNSQSQREFLYLKRKYLKHINFKENCQVLDVGCGPGDITRHGLFPLLPKSTRKLVGVDLSPEMVNFAKQYHQDDPRISYYQLDIGTDNVPTHLLESFDHAFSFYCLQFVPDLRKAMTNIHRMLKQNGEIFVNLLSNVYLFDIYEKLANGDKWKLYVHDYKRIMSPFQNNRNFKDHFRNILIDVGFNIEHCIEKRKVMAYSRDNFLGTIKAINYVDIPKHLEDEFAFDQCNVMRDADKVFIDEYGEEQIHYPYTLLIANANKR